MYYKCNSTPLYTACYLQVIWHYFISPESHSGTSEILTGRLSTLSAFWSCVLLLFYRGGGVICCVSWWQSWHHNPGLTDCRRHFTRIMIRFEIIVKDHNLIMAASFPCILMARHQIFWRTWIEVWRNRLRFEDVKL